MKVGDARAQRGAARALAALGLAALGGCSLLHSGRVDIVMCVEEGAHGLPACPEGETCVGGTCTALGAPPGYGCEDDGDCLPGSYCAAAPGPGGGVGSAGPVCVKPCCAATDCGDPEVGLVCAEPDGWVGGRVCLRADALAGRAWPGAARAGSACQAGSDCRSGVCGGDGRCLDYCCDDSYCAAEGDACSWRVTALGPEPAWTCGPAVAAADLTPCHADGECRSGACLAVGATVKVCATPCCSSGACGTALVDAALVPLACVAVEGTTVRACAALVGPLAVGEVGAPCAGGEACRSGICRAEGYCSDVCCSDASCGDTARFACRQVGDAPAWSLQCVLK
ncbi:MAG: hypothetical protein HY908_26765 [Myxococcales bacterium]|nr:hypothetical protein [Myxococcales bacterium]